jgi:hypothetical protein
MDSMNIDFRIDVYGSHIMTHDELLLDVIVDTFVDCQSYDSSLAACR